VLGTTSLGKGLVDGSEVLFFFAKFGLIWTWPDPFLEAPFKKLGFTWVVFLPPPSLILARNYVEASLFRT